MDLEGPPLETLLHRISEVPAEFLLPPRIGATGTVVVPAVVHDVSARLGVELSTAELQTLNGIDPKRDTPRLSVTLLLTWVLADDCFQGVKTSSVQVLELLRDSAAQLAQHASAAKYIHDPDRREELGRFALAHFGMRPAGETKAQATDRLNSLSSVERERVIRAARQAEERARSIRAALAKKAAEESADKWTRE